MNERRRPPRRGRGPRPFGRPPTDLSGETNPYRDVPDVASAPEVGGENGPVTPPPAVDAPQAPGG